MKGIRETLFSALDAYRGDDLERARLQAQRLTEDQMDTPFGSSGMTFRQLLAKYEEHVRAVERARDWVDANVP